MKKLLALLLCAAACSFAAKLCHTDNSAAWPGTTTVNGNSYTGLPLSAAGTWVCNDMTTRSVVSGPPADGDYIMVGPDPSGTSNKAHLLIADVNIKLGATTTKPYWRSRETATWSGPGSVAHVAFTTALPAGTANGAIGTPNPTATLKGISSRE